MTTLNFLGTPTLTNAYGVGSLVLPTQQSVREKIRSAVAYGVKNTITKANGYYNDIGSVDVQANSYSKIKEFPNVSLLWLNEQYTNSNSGGHTLHAYEKITELLIEAWFNVNQDMVLQRENFIADIEKYFGVYYYIPDANGVATCFSSMLISNNIFGMEENEPKGGVQLTLRIWYRVDIDNPCLAV